MHFLFMMNLASFSNFNSPFYNSWSDKFKFFLQRPASAFLSQIFKIQSFLTDSVLFVLFLKNHIIYYPVFPCIFTEEIMAARIAEVSKIHYFRQQSTCEGTLSM